MLLAEMGPPDRPGKTEEEHNARAAFYLERDPFPSVPHGLLSSAEIADYIRITSMMDEYCPDHLKSASYEAFAGGEFIYWEKDKRKRKLITKKDYSLKLPANSITFVQTRATFRLPSYIAVRFNLRISHVHRGLLLGTGPLVDPGYQGRLLVPLHNLTSTEYQLDLSKALIWIEFTKTTANFDNFLPEERKLHQKDRSPKAKEFPKDKCFVEPDEYLFKASGGRTIESSIPAALEQASTDAKEARASSESLQQWARGIGIIAVLGAIVAVTGVVSTSWNTIWSAHEAVVKSNASLNDAKLSIGDLKQKLKFLDDNGPILQITARELQDLRSSQERITRDARKSKEDADRTIDELRKEVERLNIRIDERLKR